MTARAYWLAALATRTGQDPGLLGTKAVPRWCARCRRLVLAGYDAPVCATLCIADPYRLTPQLEAACVILARPTYQLWGIDAGRLKLTSRHIPGFVQARDFPPADHVVVLAAHDCDRPPLTLDPLPEPRYGAVQPGDVPPY
ncbi:hypothetical protein FA014_01990 [Cellulomonas hominis]|uniref:Uncharacterized protein n=1 Tax=Cellulomonas hominis TaxID=156981 RepID=A0A7Z8NQL9_9CELL|nr:hypothetical protein [Cellulomonas hominis]TKR27151.1 hypothetical protein FA014_01990 [Cellulomonas hominis]